MSRPVGLAGCPAYIPASLITGLRARRTARSTRLNSRIQAIRVSARGYRNREHFKTAIWFHLGGLQLYPAIP
ncbi:MAG: hypothetical protein ACYDEY_14385 [Acidimicrobiales bacterium]